MDGNNDNSVVAMKLSIGLQLTSLVGSEINKAKSAPPVSPAYPRFMTELQCKTYQVLSTKTQKVHEYIPWYLVRSLYLLQYF